MISFRNWCTLFFAVNPTFAKPCYGGLVFYMIRPSQLLIDDYTQILIRIYLIQHSVFSCQGCFAKILQYKINSKIWSVQNEDCRLQIGYKMQTKYEIQYAECRTGTKCRLRTKTVFSSNMISKRAKLFLKQRDELLIKCTLIVARTMVWMRLNMLSAQTSAKEK